VFRARNAPDMGKRLTMAQALIYVVALILFLIAYALLRQRAHGRTGEVVPVKWGWLALIVVCAVVAVAIGAATR
jgi:multisubunit Na+/H+ antiporter MnhB subunit